MIKKTRTAPDDIPFSRNARAIGTDAVEQIYIGILTISIDNIEKNDPVEFIKKLSGINVLIIEERIIPTINGFDIFFGNEINP
tara:strand:+ start:444 stop:692 length:249 start_codon:yes stop_codon:yes gene_type:complete